MGESLFQAPALPPIGSLYMKRDGVGFVLLVDGTWSDDVRDGRAAIFFRAHDAVAFLEKCRRHMSESSYNATYYSTKGV